MKRQINFKSGNEQISDDDTTIQIQISGWAASILTAALVILLIYIFL